MILIHDVETGGLNPVLDGVLQMAGMLCEEDDELTVVDEFNEYIYPPESLLVRPGAVEATGIDTARVYAADVEADVAPRFSKFVKRFEERPRYVAFNAPFDLSFMSAMSERLAIDFGYEAEDPAWVCLMRLTRKLVPKKTFVGRYGQDKNPKLIEACNYFGIEHADAHDALADVRASRQLWLHLVDRFGKSAIPG